MLLLPVRVKGKSERRARTAGVGWADRIRRGEVLNRLHVTVAKGEETLAHDLAAAWDAAADDCAAHAHWEVHVGRRGTGIPVDFFLDSGPNGCV